MDKETFRLKKAGWIVLCLAGLCLFSVLLIQAGKVNAEAQTITTEATATESKEQMYDASMTQQAVSSSITFSKKKKSLKAGKSFRFQVKTVGITDKVTFKVSDSKLAKINSSGKLTALRVGKVKVTAIAGDYSVSVLVTIKPKKNVALDPGHSAKVTGGTEPIGPGSSTKKAKDSTGTKGVSSGQMEYELTMKLAKKMKLLLEDKGYLVVLTRSNNKKAISCVERAKVANKAGADIFVRIHADGINNASVFGASALYPSSRNPYVNKLSSKSKKLSSCVLNAMCKEAGAKSRGLVARDDLSGSNWAKMPVTLIEAGFMTNKEEDKKLAQDSYQDKLAKGMVQGIEEYFGY